MSKVTHCCSHSDRASLTHCFTAVAVNDVSVIVATSANYIRIFSLSGLQIHIFNLSSIVAITAVADLALLVYHTGIGAKGKV